MSPKIYPFKNVPGAILGFRKDGRPIRAIAGASEMIVEPTGITITPPVEPPVDPPPTPLAQAFTAEDIENARKQEKDKLYDRIVKTDEVVKKLQDEQKKRLDAETKARKDAEDAAEAERQKMLTFEQKFAESNSAFEAKLAGMAEQVAQRDALIEAERQFQAVQSYRAQRLTEADAADIMPQLVDMVSGHSEEEIDASILRAVEKSEAILAEFANHQQNVQQQQIVARQNARGTTVTAPPVGPMENQSEQMTFSAEDIKNMSIQDYAKYRPQLMNAASAARRGA